ncbi:MAG: hypothetical protein Q9180_004442, partial [Flavoplaca navasiana]
NLTGREPTRSWLAADEDGVLADFLVYDEKVLGKLPTYLDWVQASIIPCAGVTAWSALKGAGIGQSVLIQGDIYYLACRHWLIGGFKALVALLCLLLSLPKRWA